MKQHAILPPTPEQSFPITISIADHHYAFQAIKWDDISGMVKQVNLDELRSVIVQLFKDTSFDRASWETTTASTRHQHSSPATVTISTSKGIELLPAEDILYCVASSNYTWIHTATKGKHLVSKPIKFFEELLQSPQFFRIHNSYLVNLKRVCAYSLGNTFMLEMQDGQQLEVSKRRKAAFRKTIKSSFSPIPIIP